jgi:nitrite reductase/ring-hydroxylating ferredoxin subunit
MTWTELCSTDEIRVGEGKAFEVGNSYVAIFNVEGEFCAIDDECTHEEASLAEGFVEGHLVECPLHGSQFNVRTGEVLSLPAVVPVRSYPVKLENGRILVELG